jgi:anti-anti-sigma factor
MNHADGTLTIVTDDGDPIDAGDSAVFRLRGEIDGQTCSKLDIAAGAPADAGRTVVLDLSEVSFVDSAGLRTMVGLDRRAKAAGGSLELRSPNPTLTRLLELTSLDRLFDIR